MEAVQSAQSPLAFTHSPGCMFLSDRESTPVTVTSDPEQRPMAFRVSQQPLHYSLVSKATVQRIQTLEQIIGEDPGERGIRALFVQDELLKSCLSLSHASSVLITTGFPTHFMHDPPEETDGPPGAIAMAAALQALGKEVALVVDHRALEMNTRIMEDAVEKGVIKTAVPLLSFQNSGQESALRFLCQDGDPKRPRFDHLVAIERSGRAADGNYYNMRGVNIKHLVDPIDDLFTAASTIAGITTTGIGDGGNELGMGKVKEAVSAHMPNGGLIACDVAADFAVTAGVSNWGGYARLGCCLPTVAKEEQFLAILVKYGIRSGKTGNLAMEVDALPFHPAHVHTDPTAERCHPKAPRTPGLILPLPINPHPSQKRLPPPSQQ
ncbi:hypothetical protein SKAU_G00341530 [Synaphobranchus kaupii]|uniref:D-glutamate cyclase-like C-terminal domain-containing protein n=1 Tax=Synaphobranchus kaupii TaxID=118154 RepID=A0A9Q1EN47_SYNKA|nr:hypothetical protein SKAU_G00341530 [Synaphobranchus kaupii]